MFDGGFVERRVGSADKALRHLSHRQDFQSSPDLSPAPGLFLPDLMLFFHFSLFKKKKKKFVLNVNSAFRFFVDDEIMGLIAFYAYAI